MTTQDWARLKEDAQDLLDGLDLSKLTKNGFVTLGACVAILDHVVEVGQESTLPIQTMAQGKPEPPTMEKIKELVKEELSGADSYLAMGFPDIAKDEMRHADFFLAMAKQQAATPEDKAFVREMWTYRNLIAPRLQ